jgi:hypothetical protein
MARQAERVTHVDPRMRLKRVAAFYSDHEPGALATPTKQDHQR